LNLGALNSGVIAVTNRDKSNGSCGYREQFVRNSFSVNSPKSSPNTARAMSPALRHEARELPASPRRSVDGVRPGEYDLHQADGPVRLHASMERFPDADKPVDPAALAIRSDIDSLADSPAHELRGHVVCLAGAIVRLTPELASLRTPLSSLPVGQLEALTTQADTCFQLLSELCSAFADATSELRPIPNSKSAEDLKQLVRDFENWAGQHFVEFTKSCEELRSALGQSGEIESRASSAVQPPRCAVEQPKPRRIVPDTNVARAATELQIRYEAAQRVKAFQTEIGGRGKSVNPPARVSVTAGHVRQALNTMLADMPGPSADSFRLEALRAPEDLFVPGTQWGRHPETTGPGQQALRFEPAVTLTMKGRELLASYYARKYDADIVFTTALDDDAAELDPAFIERCRQKTGDVVRSALYRGHGENLHGSLLVYAREGVREALILFDSAADESSLNIGIELAKDAAPLALDGKPIEVFQHVRAIQKDWQSCWIFAMKTAVTLTGRQPDGRGGFKDFLMPDLIYSLDSRRLNTPAPAGINPVWALPEVVRASQSMTSVLADAGEYLDTPMRSAKAGVTLRSFIEKYTYTLRDGTQQLDYIRQKGHRADENAEIQAWSEQISEALSEDLWTTGRQIEFAAQIKTVIHGRREFSVDHNIDTLQRQLGDPAKLIWQGLKAHTQIIQELCSVNEMAQPALEYSEDRFHRPIALLGKLRAQLEKCFHAYHGTTMPVAIAKFRDQILQQLQSSSDMAAEMIQASRDRKRNELALLNSLASAGKNELAQGIAGIALTSPPD